MDDFLPINFITFQNDVEFEEDELLWKKQHFEERRRRECSISATVIGGPIFRRTFQPGRQVYCAFLVLIMEEGIHLDQKNKIKTPQNKAWINEYILYT